MLADSKALQARAELLREERRQRRRKRRIRLSTDVRSYWAMHVEAMRASRRRFTDEEKLGIVTESKLPGATAAEICRSHGIITSMLFRWRVQHGFSRRPAAKLATVTVTRTVTELQTGALVLSDLLQFPDGMTVVELHDGRRVFAPIGSDPDAVRRQIIERETAR